MGSRKDDGWGPKYPKPIKSEGGLNVGSIMGAGLVAKFANAALVPPLYSSMQIAWKAAPVMMPSVSDILDAYIRRLFDDNSAAVSCLESQGVNIGLSVATAADPKAAEAWRAVQKMAYEVPSISEAMSAFQAGFINDKQWLDLMVRNGAEVARFKPFLDFGGQTLSVADVLSMWDRQLLSDKVDPKTGLSPLDFALKRAGVFAQTDRDRFKLLSSLLSIQDAVVLYNRHPDEKAKFHDRLRKLGFRDIAEQDAIAELANAIPNAGDLINMSVKDVFTPEVANKLRLYDEYPAKAQKWFQAQGLGGGPQFGIQRDGQNVEATWLDMYWGSHWRNVAPQEAYAFLHRLRPDKIERYRKMGLKVDPYTMADLHLDLRVNDYAPGRRDYLAAVSYRPLDRRQVLQGVRLGVLNKEEVRSNFLDTGSAPDTADKQTDIAFAQADFIRRAPERATDLKAENELVRITMDAFERGLVTDTQVRDTLFHTHVSLDAAELMITNSRLQVRMDMAKEAVAGFRRDFLSGQLSAAEAILAMQRIGITNERINAYISVWAAGLSHRRKIATTGQILKWVRIGILDVVSARVRLANLGWTDPDAILLLAEVKGQQAKDFASQQRTAASNARQQAGQIQAAIRQQKKTITDMQQKLRSLTPISTMKKWLKICVIGDKFFRSRLRAMGYPDEVITSYITEVNNERKKECTPPEETNGQRTT